MKDTLRSVIALAVFQFVLLYTHPPAVVDSLMVTPLGSFAIAALWLAAGCSSPSSKPCWRCGCLGSRCSPWWPW